MTQNTSDTHDQPTPDADQLVPVSEAIRYRKRAQAAEQQLGELNQQLDALRSELESTRDNLGVIERQRRIDELLERKDPIDPEAARLLAEVAVSQMEEPDVELAVEDLARHRPYLFHQRVPHASTMAPRTDPEPDAAEHAAAQATRSGDRRDLLAYLRLRRNA